MLERKKINELRIDLAETRQFKKFVSEITEEELKKNLESQVKIMKNWIKATKNRDKAQLFASMQPIGTVLPEYKKLESCYILYNLKSNVRPAINQIVLIYDEKYDDILSGIIQNLKPLKKSGQEGIIIVIDLLFVHKDVKLRKRKHITQLVSNQCLVFNTTPEQLIKIYGMPDQGIKLGICSYNGDIIETKVGGPLFYLLKPELLKTHLMIGGVTGQGKTIFLKNLIYELAVNSTSDYFGPERVKKKVISNNALIFDLQGDLVQILEPMMNDLIDDQYKEQYKDLKMDEFIGLKQKITNSDILFLKPFYVGAHGFLEMFPWINFGLCSANIKTAEELISLIPGLTKKGRQIIIQLYSMFIVALGKRIFNFNEFFEFVIEGVQQDIKGRKNYKWAINGTNTFETTTTAADAMIRQLKVFKTLNVFDNEPEIDINILLNKSLVFIYFPDCQGYTQVRSIMLLDILTRMYYAKRHNADQAIKNNLIVIDEAHELLPRKKKSSDLSDDFFRFIEKRFTRIAKEGRKYGMSLVISTQILSELNNEVKYNAQSRIYFKLSEKDIKDLNLDNNTINLIDALKKGYAVVYSRDNLEIGRAIEIKVLPPVFLHCDPRVADKYFESTIKEIKAERIRLRSNSKKKKGNETKNFFLFSTY
ncbi:MAG: ATP-binding protein [Promethearchaeota archaeon]